MKQGKWTSRNQIGVLLGIYPVIVMCKLRLTSQKRSPPMTYDRPRFEVLRGPKREKIGPDDFLEIDHQGNLFAAPRRGLLIFVYFPDVTEEEFRNTLIN